MKKLLIAFLVLLAVAAGSYLQRHRILVAMGTFLVSEDPLVPSDAIAVLSGGLPERILEGVDLFHRGLAPRILLTPSVRNARVQARMKVLGVEFPLEVEFSRRIALKKGVPPKAIVLVKPIESSTKAEAERILAFMKDRNLRSLIVVTSKFHTTRTRYIFQSVAGSGARVIVRASRYDDFDPNRWWRKRFQSKMVFNEYVKLFNHFLVGF